MQMNTSEQASRPGLLRFWPLILCVVLRLVAMALFLAGPRARAPGPERPPAAQQTVPGTAR